MDLSHSPSRCFIGIPIPAKTQSKLHRALGDILPSEPSFSLPGKTVPSENWHITLQFLGNIDEDKINLLKNKLTSSNPPFSVQLGPLGAFPEMERARALWAGFSKGADDLTSLAMEIQARTKNLKVSKTENKAYLPHITLSRLKHHQNLSHLRKLPLLQIEWTIEEFVLYESKLQPEGPFYLPLKAFSL
jgi:RNA 2',3'-cyclic 3'-phosphodiesterase